MRTTVRVLVVFVLASHTCWATTILRASLQEYVAAADNITHGTVTIVEPLVEVCGREACHYSLVTLEVTDMMKGDPADTISIVVPGSVRQDDIIEAVGAPALEAGDEVIVYSVYRESVGYNILLGYTYGVTFLRHANVPVEPGNPALDPQDSIDAIKSEIVEILDPLP